ncbi:T4 family baseplate hub assembly chaperone [Aliikangiella sp. IMCC44359]|uniref:T4 family baseplate hub assembly chaperone n=1 Tax=Aliikangiella sp. IMCC44359 TaxID=3459125 RepID=UPI00403AA1A8
MSQLSAEKLLAAWEQGLDRPILEKVMILLMASYPEIKPDTFLNMSIGQRDQYLFKLRQSLFGQQLFNSVNCPQCEERLEWENKVSDFLAVENDFSKLQDSLFIEVEGYKVFFRLPNSIDISSVLLINDLNLSEQYLLQKCIKKSEYQGSECKLEDLPEKIYQELSQAIERLDSQAEILINLKCPECSHQWDVVFDIANYIWSDLNDWSVQMLQSIYRLAAAYGWSEKEILSLSPLRRQLYLGMLD